MILVDQPEQAVLKVLGAVHPTAVELMGGENGRRGPLLPSACLCPRQSSMNIDLNVEDFIYKI